MPTDNVPDVHSELEAEGIPDIDSPPPNTMETGDTGEGLMAPRDYPVAATDFGVTADEARLQEPLTDRVLREEPDPLALELDGAAATTDSGVGMNGYDPGPDGVGRLVDPEADLGAVDITAETVANDVGADVGGFSAEEAAMHITEEPLTGEPRDDGGVHGNPESYT